jgi:hypothetical protein
LLSGPAPAVEELDAPVSGVLVGYPPHRSTQLGERLRELVTPAVVDHDHASHCEGGS